MAVLWRPETGLPLVDGAGKASGASGSASVHKSPLTTSIWRKEKELRDGLFVPPLDPRKQKKLMKKDLKETTGSKWFDMPAQTLTPEMKKELQLLKLRRVLDPKRHYKADDSKALPKFFQVGTVVEGAADFYSGRLAKKERKRTFADELLTDTSVKSYTKRKYEQIQNEKQAGGKGFWNQRKNSRKSSKGKR